MLIYQIDGTKISDWKSFHNEFKTIMKFPDYYGENMNAWIDCVDDITDQMTLIQIVNGKALKNKNPEILEAMLECSAFINYRKNKAGEKPNLVVSGDF